LIQRAELEDREDFGAISSMRESNYFSPTKFIMAKSRIGMPKLVMNGIYHTNKKEYVDDLWVLEEDSVVKYTDKLNFDI
jgi:hypothetical protein